MAVSARAASRPPPLVFLLLLNRAILHAIFHPHPNLRAVLTSRFAPNPQNWADEDANHLPSIPQGFGGFPGSPVRGGAFPSGLSPPGGGFSPPGGLGGVFHPPPGMPGFAPGRSPPNYSFGTGVPNAANDGRGPPGGGYPGAPDPHFSGPRSPGSGNSFHFGAGPTGASPPQPHASTNGVPPIGSPPSPGRGYQEARPARPTMPVPSSPPFTAFVGNFPYECPREEVVGLFTANACAIADVRMVRNRDTDRPRGYFLEFEDKASLERALTFDQYNMGGRPLRVNVAEGKPDRRDRFGGGGGFADRYNERDRRGGGFADRYNDATGGKPGGGGSFGRREGGAGYQEARGGGGGGGRGDKASFTGGGYHAPRGGGGDRGRRSFDRDPDAPPPEGRKKLELKPRSADADAAQPSAPASGSSSKPNPFGSAKPVDTTAKIAEAERKIQEEKDRVNAKAGVAAKGEVPAPKPLSKSAVQPDAKRKPIVLAPEENAKIEATNVFALLNMDDDEDGDDTEADAKDGDGEEEAKEEL
ncbi:predicted protein [Micromonas commoda]|uniref:RRM domain-containing protein n=1 Tax=Micromonas commoda (strain RCC299 / NOUM17 / CCMP2709) TaxID=296587 RepID=C1DZK7_MICCC|nr:predicted protein [Micromonas commoda]ACO60668.1 predicted protein [Micromonas commoda]|eukprot:XP_002499409.1 predicted protein [Micromonas commoda]